MHDKLPERQAPLSYLQIIPPLIDPLSWDQWQNCVFSTCTIRCSFHDAVSTPSILIFPDLIVRGNRILVESFITTP